MHTVTFAPPVRQATWLLGGADWLGRHSIYGLVCATWARASPLLLWSVQGTRAGAQAEDQLKEGL
jgi:hypothetical protein